MLAGVDDVGDEAGPGVRPLLLDDLHQDDVDFAHEDAVGAEKLLIARALDHEVDHKRLDAGALLGRQ